MAYKAHFVVALSILCQILLIFPVHGAVTALSATARQPIGVLNQESSPQVLQTSHLLEGRNVPGNPPGNQRNKRRIYLALYTRMEKSIGEERKKLQHAAYHWAILICPKKEKGGDTCAFDSTDAFFIDPETGQVHNRERQFRFNVKENVTPERARRLLGRIEIGKLDNDLSYEQVRRLFEVVPVPDKSIGETCVDWALCAITHLQVFGELENFDRTLFSNWALEFADAQLGRYQGFAMMDIVPYGREQENEQRNRESQVQRQLQAVDWSLIQIPDESRPETASGLMTPSQCATAMTALFALWQARGPKQKRQTQERAQPQNECARLAHEVELVEPSACNLEYLKIDFLLADERWAGTDHMMDLVVHGNFSKTASEPIRLGYDMDRGWSHTQRIDLAKEFQKDSILVESIKKLELWSGKDELWVQDLRLRGRCAASKQQMAMEKFVNLDKKMSSPGDWDKIWSGDVKVADWHDGSCGEIDSLEVEIRLKDAWWAGTADALDLVIVGDFLGRASYPIRLGRDMNRGWRHRQKIDMASLNDGPAAFAGASHISGLELRSASGDQIKLESITVLAKCADSIAEAVIDDKWNAIDQWVEADKQDYGKIWYGAIEAKDWSWRPPCFEFDELKVAIHLADNWFAGTDGPIDVTFNLEDVKTQLASDPDRDYQATKTIPLEAVFGKKVLSVVDIKQFSIWTGTDEIRVKSLRLLARCAKSGKQVVFDRYASLDTKMEAESGYTDVWTGQVYPTGWKLLS